MVPVTNARYALNAANARWGSLYDALYGTDAIGDEDGLARGARLQRGARRAGDRDARRAFSTQAVPLADGSHADAAGYAIVARRCSRCALRDGSRVGLLQPATVRGLCGRGRRAAPPSCCAA